MTPQKVETNPLLRPKTAEETLAWMAQHPIDLERIRQMAQLSPAERILSMLKEVEEIKEDIKEEFRELYPDLSESELNMEVLKHLTPIKMPRKISNY